MSLYNMCCGESENADKLLEVLGLSRDDCGRYRDCYLHDNQIIIYTRNGGGNREEYQDVIDELAKHPNYVNDYDDDFDNTYCYIVFSIPENAKLPKTANEKTPNEKFEDAINRIKGMKQ